MKRPGGNLTAVVNLNAEVGPKRTPIRRIIRKDFVLERPPREPSAVSEPLKNRLRRTTPAQNTPARQSTSDIWISGDPVLCDYQRILLVAVPTIKGRGIVFRRRGATCCISDNSPCLLMRRLDLSHNSDFSHNSPRLRHTSRLSPRHETADHRRCVLQWPHTGAAVAV